MDPSSRVVLGGIGERYEIERELGRGGMATVYLARDVRHDRRVAVKVMRPDVSASLSAERFEREVRVLARLSHPHILALHDSGRVPVTYATGSGTEGPAGDLLYYVMPYVPGESLRDRLRREGSLAIADALRIASEVADALSYAHAQGIVHRDIKPENVLLTGTDASADSWHALVADFGIARLVADAGPELTATGISVGTPAYMSPEQASGERAVDARADVYSLGCLLYEMLVGEPPFTGPNASAIIARHLTAPAPSIRAVRPTVSADLEALVHRALEKVPADRVASATELKTAIDRIRARGSAADHPAAALASSRAEPASHRGHGGGRRRTVVATVTVVTALGIAAAWIWFPGNRGAPSAQPSTPSTLDRHRVAVVPLRSIGDAGDPYLVDAYTDDLISALGRVGGIRVLARSAVASADASNRSPATIARSVGAGSFIEGTFHQRSDSVRVTMTLVDANSGEQLWNKTYRRRSHELAGLQDSVAVAVARQLGASGMRGVAGSATRPATANGAAYDAYLRGTFLMSRRPVPARSVADSAIRFFELAVELDSGFALAHAAIARVANTLYFNTNPDPAWEERAFVEIEKALALDPNLAEAYHEKGSLTWTKARGFQHEASARLHRKASMLKPSFVEPHNALGSIYMHVGLLDRALAEYDSALALDPTTNFVPPRIARIHWYQGKYAEALREFEALANRPNSAGMPAERALVLNYLGRGADALAVLDSALAVPQSSLNYDLHAARAVVLATGANREAALAAIRQALRGDTAASHFHHAAYSLAQAFALLGDHDRALEFLRLTAANGMPCYPLFRDDPHLRGLATDPRFVQFMSDLRERFDRLSKILE